MYLLKNTLTNIGTHSGSRNGQHYDEDIVFERETGGRRALDGVRRSERREEEEVRELAIIDTRNKGRRFEAEKSKKDRMWTEITKDLVSEEAIKEVGYEFEETEEFYYVMEYLRYVSTCLLLPPCTFLSSSPNYAYPHRRTFSALSNLAKTSGVIAATASVRSKLNASSSSGPGDH